MARTCESALRLTILQDVVQVFRVYFSTDQKLIRNVSRCFATRKQSKLGFPVVVQQNVALSELVFIDRHTNFERIPNEGLTCARVHHLTLSISWCLDSVSVDETSDLGAVLSITVERIGGVGEFSFDLT